ncbi:Ditrans,polycis-undecaprenyl-diphosphate synthase ((2E,6E)-farnesyl-diphosphate specific) [bioreactor metagenome]|jgi:undecaprenyl diphosphate synthase|uniref:Isoprenyl transferase n=2 Tax=root TaxID=1 RepID=R9CDX2_9CLOT|nr:isoprenyl transferase [Clostridium sartagoforme]EOR27497.1 di-trans,poly-cis-decaprenylcistransferase [Clostridium sartagoforme AAU1]
MLDIFKTNKSRKNKEQIVLDKENIPKHIAIIMDGNGRWAKQRNLPRTMGHKAGVETIRKVIKESNKLGIKYLTLYAFSTENWKRPNDEVSALMKLLVEYLKNELEELNKNQVVINILGDIDKLPSDAQREIKKAIVTTKDNIGISLNIAFNYGGRDEILRAVNLVLEEVKKGNINEDSISEDIFEKYLYTYNIPDPDLIIRPSGEQRISNFLLWQCAYSEFWYSNVCWPDFKEEHLHKAIYDYQHRDRRYGGV